MTEQEFKSALARYAELLVVHGLNVQPGQIVNVSAEVCHREIAYLVAEKAYEKGAKFVAVDLSEPRLTRARVLRSSEEDLAFVPAFISAKYGEILEAGGANIKIVGPEDPNLLVDLDPKKLNAAQLHVRKALKRFYDEGIGASKVHWTVAAGSTPAWGQRVFPGATAAEAERKLWESILFVCRADRADCLTLWQEHNTALQQRARRLTEMKLRELHFTGPGTDLRVALSERAIFKGGRDMGPHGVEFEPNIPTEEVFTTPDRRGTEGVVRATRPFLINGTLIKELSLRFERGAIVEFSAAEGEATFREYISSDEGAKYLGEVALVGIDSPIYQTGLVFEEILFDENAACHIAVGSAYKFCVAGSAQMSEEELAAIGCNESHVHTDMMISSEEVSVEGISYAGVRTPLISRGKWVL